MEICKHEKTGLMYRPSTFDANVIGEQSCYRQILKHPVRVLDIGGNIGAFAYMAFSCGAKFVRSFEPEPNNYQMLLINKQGNHETHNKAVVANSCKEKKLPLSVNTGINKGLHSLIKRRGRASVSVETIVLNRAFANVDFDVVKIDIEGYEYDLLENFVFPMTVKSLAIEYHFDRHVYENRRASILHNSLADQGFYAINNGNINKNNFATLMLYRR